MSFDSKEHLSELALFFLVLIGSRIVHAMAGDDANVSSTQSPLGTAWRTSQSHWCWHRQADWPGVRHSRGHR